MAVILGVAAIGTWAVGTGKVSYVITHGISMEPVYHQGDLVFLVKEDSYQLGQIAAYHGSGLEVLHRIIGGDDTSGFVFKGDNNQSIDVVNPTGKELIGRAVLHVPKGGTWLKPLLSPTGVGMLGFLIFSAGAAKPRTRREIPRGRRKKKVTAMGRQQGLLATAATVLKAVGRLSPLLRVSAILVIVMTALAVTLGIVGWMKPVARETASPEKLRSVTFAYSAKVPPSPAYDSTTATSPDPIFRKLADKVDVRVSYRGRPGALAVTADVADGSGWHTAMDIAPSKRFLNQTYDTTLKLDLAVIEKRAKAAAKAIGIQPATVSITLKASVINDGVPPFTAPLQLLLDPIQLRLAGDATTLSVTESPTKKPPTFLPREITVLGQAIMTASRARSFAMLLLFGAAVGATVIALALRRKTPLRTRADIERRHSQLLVPVEPMPSPPGKPVVNVDNFPALVKLAERYGQMILTWRRPEADDFVVRDEGITYRYRVPLEEATLHNIEHLDRPNAAGSHRRKASSQVS